LNPIPPVAIDDDSTTFVNLPISIQVLNNDTINGTLVSGPTVISFPTNGTVEVNGEQLLYLPNTDACGFVDSFQYIIENEVGIDSAWVNVEVLCDDITVFTGFSPNGDGINDVFTIQGIDRFDDNRVRVYNRWGNLVFDRGGYKNADGWRGDWVGNTLPDGTYFYVVEYTDADNNPRKLSGYVQINR